MARDNVHEMKRTAQRERVDAVRHPKAALRVAVAGLGAIGLKVAEALDRGIPGCMLEAVSANDRSKAVERLSHLSRAVPVVALAKLEPLADIVVECAPAKLLPAIAEPFLRAGKTVIVLSCGALLANEHLVGLARQHGGQIVVPTGALIGLDAVAAAAEGEIRSVRMITRKPVRGLAGAPYLTENNIRIEDITEPLRIFTGTAREAATGFPANLNVAVALSLAGIGADKDHARYLGRSLARAERASGRGRGRFRYVLDVDRKRAVGQSQDRADHGAVSDRIFAKIERAVAGGIVISGTARG